MTSMTSLHHPYSSHGEERALSYRNASYLAARFDEKLAGASGVRVVCEWEWEGASPC